jgi:hypothetical protein
VVDRGRVPAIYNTRMSRPFALFLFLAIACGVFAQEPDDPAAIVASAAGPDEARARVKEYVRANPGQASGHLVAAKTFETQGFPVPALFAYMRFLALEPSSPRSADAATRLRNLMAAICEQKKTDDGKISFASKSRKDEGDFALTESLVWVVSNRLEMDSPLLNPFHGGGGTDFDKAVFVLAELIRTEFTGKEDKQAEPNFTSTVQRPFFAALDRRSLVVPYAGLALSSLNLAGTEEWMKKNAKAVDRYRTWMQSQAAKPGAR